MIGVEVHLFCVNDEDRDRLATVIRAVEEYARIIDGNSGEELLDDVSVFDQAAKADG